MGWNCRGLENPRTVRALRDLIKGHNPKFVFLIETLSFAKKIKDLKIRFGFDQCFSVDKLGRSGGLAVLWKAPINFHMVSYSHNHIDVVFMENNVDSGVCRVCMVILRGNEGGAHGS